MISLTPVASLSGESEVAFTSKAFFSKSILTVAMRWTLGCRTFVRLNKKKDKELSELNGQAERQSGDNTVPPLASGILSFGRGS